MLEWSHDSRADQAELHTTHPPASALLHLDTLLVACGRAWLRKDGRVYEGQFADDLKHGDGTLTWPDGYTYKGGFRKGVQHGDGQITENGKTHAVKFEKGHQLK